MSEDTPAYGDYWDAAIRHAQRTRGPDRQQPTSTKRHYQHREHQEQVALIARVRKHLKRYPELRLLLAVPNGAYLPRKRDPQSGRWYSLPAQRLVAEGMSAGAPDLLLLLPRHGKAYLALEMKSSDGRLKPEQQEWRDRIQAAGGAYAVCKSADAAWDLLMKYIGRSESK